MGKIEKNTTSSNKEIGVEEVVVVKGRGKSRELEEKGERYYHA